MKKRFWIAGGLVLVVGIVAALILLPPGGQENTARVIEAVNTVDAHSRSKDDWQPAAVDMLIYGGGQVRTGAVSWARLELLEGAVRLSADSVFTVKDSATRQGVLVTTLSLQQGRLWVHLTTDESHEFAVETGNAVAAVRDTRLSAWVLGNVTLVSVAEGEVTLTAQGQSVTVRAGEQATVEDAQPPSLPGPMSDDERTLWSTEGEMPRLAPPTPTPMPTAPTEMSAFTPTPVPSSTPTPSPTLKPIPTLTIAPLSTPSPTPAETSAPTLTPTLPPTPKLTPTSTPTIAPLPTPTQIEPVGERIVLYDPPEPRIEFPAGEPFHIRHGWLDPQDPLELALDFELEVDGVLRDEDFILTTIDQSGGEQQIGRQWLHNFTDGMTGTHTFTAHWFAPCQWAVDNVDFPGPCATPDEKIEVKSNSLTVDFP